MIADSRPLRDVEALFLPPVAFKLLEKLIVRAAAVPLADVEQAVTLIVLQALPRHPATMRGPAEHQRAVGMIGHSDSTAALDREKQSPRFVIGTGKQIRRKFAA